jgi:NAD(P)-dependent dehydrogenase (short-subunit alcohol dehydrogenase family)
MPFEFWTASREVSIVRHMNLGAQHFVIFGGSSGIGLGTPRLRGRGSFTVTSGIAADRPMPGGAIIAAANGALAPLRVNAVSPGWVDTPVWENIAGDRKATLHAQMAERLPVRQIGTVADLAHAILFLTQNPFTTGAVLSVDGGHRFV